MKKNIKVFLLALLAFFVCGCDLIKPLPGNDTITVGKEGYGIDKLADKVMKKADKVEDYIVDLRLGEETVKEEDKGKLSLEGEEEYTDLTDTTDKGGKGVATRIYEKGQFALEVTSELSLPKDDSFYECWLVNDDPMGYVSAGKLIKETDGKYHLKFIVNNDYTNYDKIVVTLEADDENPYPAATVLQGKF